MKRNCKKKKNVFSPQKSLALNYRQREGKEKKGTRDTSFILVWSPGKKRGRGCHVCPAAAVGHTRRGPEEQQPSAIDLVDLLPLLLLLCVSGCTVGVCGRFFSLSTTNCSFDSERNGEIIRSKLRSMVMFHADYFTCYSWLYRLKDAHKSSYY